MSKRPRKQALKVALFSVFVCLLLWNLGAGILPISTIQDSDSNTPTTTLSNESQPESPTPTFTSTATPTGPASIPSSTQIITSATVDENRVPMPAIFATGAYAPDELIVRFKSSTNAKRINECFQGVDVHVQTEIEELHALVLTSDSGDIDGTFNYVLNCAGVLYVEPNFLLQAADTIPNDPDWGLQYGLVNIRAPQGWDLSRGSSSVTIAIVDTGVDLNHLDLVGKLVAGYDFVNNDTDPQDDNGHGTHVAGIAAASTNNALGIAGVSWGARIMPVKVLNASGGGTYANTATGVIWAVDHGAQVINLSLGGTGPSSVLEDAINYAHSKGAVVVAAAGNGGTNFVLYPARYPNVIAVARTDSSNHWDGSNYGPEVDLAAPGTSIYSTVIGGYDYKSGSSMATGFVSGLAAVLKGVAGNTSPDTIESQLESTALDIEFAGWDEYTGAGLIQMDAAIQQALQEANRPTETGSSSTGGGGSAPIQIAPTNTPIPTWTASLTPPPQEATVTFTPESGPNDMVTETFTSTPTEQASEVQTQESSGTNTYILPCAGIMLILLGILWILAVRRKQRSL
jgi:thermitase